MLEWVERAAVEIGLYMNAKKTDHGSKLDQVHDFQYLEAWIDYTEADIKIRKALAWKACSKLTKI